MSHFAHHHFRDHGLSDARIIPAIIIQTKHTTNINDTIIFARAHIIVGNAFVASLLLIQFQIIGKQVFNLTQSHG
jgi:hypothetical protein